MGLENWRFGKSVCGRGHIFLMAPSQVFDHSNRDGSGFDEWDLQVAFLGEFRIVVAYDDTLPDTPGLAVFNTLVPQDHPQNLRWFRFPPKYLGRHTRLVLDCDRSLGTANRDGHIIVDPTQAILVLELSPTSRQPRTFLILRMQPLIDCARSMRTDTQIPWDERGRGLVSMEIPLNSSHFITIVHGARVLVIHDALHGPGSPYRINTHDFTRRGSATLPLSDGDDGGIERRAVFDDGQSCVFGGVGQVSLRESRTLGDTMPFSLVSFLSYRRRRYRSLTAWSGNTSGLYSAFFGHDVKPFP